MRAEAAECLKAELHNRGLAADRPSVPELCEKVVAPEPAPTVRWGKLRFINFVCAHTLIATLIPTLTVSTFIYGVRSLVQQFAPQWSWYTYEVISLPLFPFQSIVSLICGVIVSRETGAFWKSRAASFSWLIPCVLFAPAFFSYTPGLGEGRWQHYFWSSDILTRIQQIRSTLPVLTSLGYSFGHWWGTRVQHRRQVAISGSL